MKILKKKIRSKRAFSEVLAALIMMLLAVAAGVVVYAYVMGWIGGATTNPKMSGHLSFDTTYANTTGSKINLAIRNVGGTNLVISNVYVQSVDLSSSCTINSITLNATGYTLNVQQVAYLVINYTGMSTGSYYNVQVACKDGTLISQSVQAQ
jgi:hypothetical protein